ncbi:hypothetical protein MMA231_02444 [Asticcacaulis sp. MM231]|uniref:hypothetical protein n=1 Tax=Asticcacaulis sp. MM231 TaxID=3157666 RepID=UPI0032D58A13
MAMSDFIMVSDQHAFDPQNAVPSIARYGVTPHNEVYLYDNGQVDIISLADALTLQNIGQCPDVYLMFMYKMGSLSAEEANALYRQMSQTLNSSDRPHRAAKLAIYSAHTKRVIAAGATRWKAR